MIDKVMTVIRDEVNLYIDQKVDGGTVQDRVALTAFVNDAGNIAIPADTVGLGMLNIEEDRTFWSGNAVRQRTGDTVTGMLNPPVYINLQIMFTAYFSNYLESLKHISYIASFFQRKPVFNRENTASMSGIDLVKLSFELNTLGLQEQHYIWGMIGLRYIPSIIYKVKMLSILEQDEITNVPNVLEIITDAVIKREAD